MEDGQGYQKCRTPRTGSQVDFWLGIRKGGKAKGAEMSQERCSQCREGKVDASELCSADSRTGETPGSPSPPLLGKDGLFRNHG